MVAADVGGPTRIGTFAVGAALAVLFAASATPAFAACPGFASAVNYGAGSGPSSVAEGDFNADGNLDLAVTNVDSNNVSILIGSGNGTFAAAVNYGVPAGPRWVAVGDFNGDGKLDLAVATDVSNSVSILLGNGNGTFAAASNYGVGMTPQRVAVGDFNGDGRSDLAVANGGSDNISVLLGNGNGTFAAAVNYGTGTFPISVAVSDFNSDGYSDLAVVNYRSTNVSILLGNGNGTFATAVNYGVGTNPRAVAEGEFNGDGKRDLAVANSTGGRLSILLGNGNGTFATAANYTAGVVPVSVAVGEFNADGKSDLAMADYVSASILVGNGDGTFAAAVNYAAGDLPYVVIVGDFNSDGRSDLTVANYSSNNVSILLATGSCNSPPAITAGPPVTRTAGNAGAIATIATVSDAEDAPGTLLVTADLPPGITISGITNSNGTVTATVAASCSTVAGTRTVILTAQDSGGAKSTASFSVNVANNPPTLGHYTNTAVSLGGSVTVTPSAAPADDVSVASVTGSASPRFTGTVSVNGGTGVVSVNNAAPTGSYTITVTASDNCGATATAMFVLNVGMSSVTITSMTPTSGPAAGGQSVVITGTNLSGTTVTIGGNSATVMNTTATTVTFTTPAHAAGPVDVTVTSTTGSATSTGAYTYVAAPTITFTANPTSIMVGQTSTLSWTTTNASSVTIDQGIGVEPLSGSVFVSPAMTITYALTATGVGGIATAQTTIAVMPPVRRRAARH